jgi:predicted transcriptional regulator
MYRRARPFALPLQKIVDNRSNPQLRYKLSESQNAILAEIVQHPGIRFKELSRHTGYAHGVLTYNLNVLERENSINKIRHNKTTRYYSHYIPNQDIKILSHLRINSERDLILFVLDHDLCTFNEVVVYSGKAPSTISWHLKRLCEDGVISIRTGEFNLYRLVNKELVIHMLHKYKESFTDQIVNNFVNIANEL